MKKPSALVVTVYIIVRAIVIAGSVSALIDGRFFTAFQCVLAFLLFMLPTLLECRFRLEVPTPLELTVILFIFASLFLGEVRGYYEQFPYWDTMLHISSGFLSTAIGFSMIDILNRSENIKFVLSPGFVALFAFCFAMTTGVVWEFYEFAADMLFLGDMQKDTYITEFSSILLNGGEIMKVESASLNGVLLDGWLDIGLIDTMNDLLVCALGAFIFSVFGYIYVKTRESDWVVNLMLRRKK